MRISATLSHFKSTPMNCQSFILSALAFTCAIFVESDSQDEHAKFSRILQAAPVVKRSFSNSTRALFVAGLEGSGHHAFAAMMAECEVDGCVYESQLSALSVSYNSSESSTVGLFAGADGERNNIFITKMLARMSKISSAQDTKLYYIGLKDVRLYEGSLIPRKLSSTWVTCLPYCPFNRYVSGDDVLPKRSC